MPPSFGYTLDTQLPLPGPRKTQTYTDVATIGLEVAMELLHDPEVMIKHDSLHHMMNKLHPNDEQAVEVLELASKFDVVLNPDDNLKHSTSEWHHYEITEQIPIMGFSKQITFQTALRFNEDGMEALTNPGSGVLIHGKYVVRRTEGDEKSLTLHETTTTQCSPMLGWYIKATMGRSHQNVHAFVKERFVEKMSMRK